MRAMDTGPDAAALRAERAKQQQAHERRKRERSRPAVGGRPGPLPCRQLLRPARKRRRSWAARAETICMDAYGTRWCCSRAIPTKTPQELLQLLDAAVGLSGQVTERIARLGPASNRTLQARLMRELWASLAADRRDLASLKSVGTTRRCDAWSPATAAIGRSCAYSGSWARPPAPISSPRA